MISNMEKRIFAYRKIFVVPFQKQSPEVLRSATLLENRLWYRCFPVNFVKFLRIPFFKEHLRWLPLPSHR